MSKAATLVVVGWWDLPVSSFDLFDDTRVVIGSAEDCDIVLPDPSMVSPHHCELIVRWPDILIKDLHSDFGTWLRDGGINKWNEPPGGWEPIPLFDRDEFRIGDYCRFRLATDVSGGLIERFGFRPVRLLGRGGSSSVSAVQRIRDDKLFALKSFDLPRGNSRGLLLETAVVSRFEHPGIVWHDDDYATDSTTHTRGYFLQELCLGGSVNDLMAASGGRLPLETATHIIRQLLDTLDYIHHVVVRGRTRGWEKRLWVDQEPVESETRDGSQERPDTGEAGGTSEAVRMVGLVHRDIHLGNIMVMDESELPLVKITDFGSAYLPYLPPDYADVLVRPPRDGFFSGTPGFTSKTQILDYNHAGPQVDVWAAAACYYTMLTGHTPKNLDWADPWKLSLIEEAVPIRHRNPDVPARLAEVIDTALLESPQIGCGSAAELARQINEALS